MIPSQKGTNVEPWCFLHCLHEQAVGKTVQLIWHDILLILHHYHGNAYFNGYNDWWLYRVIHIDGLVQEKCNSNVLAMKLHLSCTKPSICYIVDLTRVDIWYTFDIFTRLYALNIFDISMDVLTHMVLSARLYYTGLSYDEIFKTLFLSIRRWVKQYKTKGNRGVNVMVQLDILWIICWNRFSDWIISSLVRDCKLLYIRKSQHLD